ncbi:FadR/GntR family transcriptional regulator [Agrobacterium sp. rho-13.3]|jgi:DNA-binding FadR family transcriptional regulator|uniref:FadR/GntR family transcriptional regulator n=1 Tax=Agrobacterium sp. rho-13.3 TaxID=3072980 RepID=UPI002A0BD0E0|nr:FadR/GntR family transcriptional regulator [Agrobacterium sp. rho-13.3]MDX8310695.1 FadR/GntR family transcriptional regulator [Agrobacterium sp. rho-13.3]
MTLEFNHIRRNDNLPGRIAAEIAREINDAKMSPGDRLPTELILSKTFGVSRSVVREAIAQLRNEGFVETRQGVGAFVTDPRQRSSIRIERSKLDDFENFRDLFQLRIPLEIEAAGLAAMHRTPAELKTLKVALDAMRISPDWRKDGVAADLDFHRTIAEATKNGYFVMFIGFISERVTSAINTAFARAVFGDILNATIDEHVAIYDAIAASDAIAARDAMRVHLLGAARRVNLELETFG